MLVTSSSNELCFYNLRRNPEVCDSLPRIVAVTAYSHTHARRLADALVQKDSETTDGCDITLQVRFWLSA